MPQQQTEFKRELGLVSSIMIVVGSMIGSGIFIVSADISRNVGGGFYLLLVWLITGIVTMIAALSYGELAGMMPKAGGQYIYLKEAYGSLVGFLYGWTLFIVIQTGTIAAVGVAFAKFTSVLIPFFSEKNILFEFFFLKISAAQILAIVSIIILTYINLRGINDGKIVQNIFTFTKTFALFGIILLGIFFASDEKSISINFSNFWNATKTTLNNGEIAVENLFGISILSAIGVAMVGSLFSSDAWNNITFTAGEVVNPKKNIPRSLAIGTGIVTLLYILANVAYMSILPIVGNPNSKDVFEQGIQFAQNDRVGIAAATKIFGNSAAIIMGIVLMISTFGCNNGLILSGARVYFAMAKDKLFFKQIGKLNKNSVPSTALIIQSVWASVLCLSGTYGDLLDYVVFAVLLFYILTIFGIFILRKKSPNIERPYIAFGYPIIPAIYILIATAICVNLLIFKPQYTYPGLLIVLSGIPIYFLWKKFSN